MLPRIAGGHWLGMERRAGPVLARLSERCLELSEWLSGRPVSGGGWCPVLANPPRAGSLTAAMGRPFAWIFPSRVGFFSPLASLLSVPGRPCSLNFCLPEALPLRRLNCSN